MTHTTTDAAEESSYIERRLQEGGLRHTAGTSPTFLSDEFERYEKEVATTDAAEARAKQIDAAAQYVLKNSRRGSASLNSEQYAADGEMLLTAYRDIIGKALASGHLATAEAASGAGEREGRFWLIVREPGNVPERKGPWPHREVAHRLREFIAARPRAFIDVLTIGHDGTPEVEHGPEVLQYTDGRSMSVGRKHNQRVRDAAEEALASLPPATDPAMVTVPREDWDTAYRAFVGAFDTPLARRRHDDEYAADARRRLRDLDEALAAAPTIPATGEAMVAEQAASIVERGYRCRTCDAVFVEDHAGIMGGHPDNGCTSPNWDALDDSGKAAAIRALATIPATGHAATEGEGA